MNDLYQEEKVFNWSLAEDDLMQLDIFIGYCLNLVQLALN